MDARIAIMFNGESVKPQSSGKTPESQTFSNTSERSSEVDVVRETKIGSGVFW